MRKNVSMSGERIRVNTISDLLQILCLALCYTKQSLHEVKQIKKNTVFSKQINAVMVKLLFKIKIHSCN